MHSSRITCARRLLCLLLVNTFCLLCLSVRADLWSTAYYAAWLQGSMPASNIDYTAVSHIIHFSVEPNANGTLNTNVNGITPAYSTDLITRAHAAGKKVIICVGGADTQAQFQGATSAANRAAFITRLVNFMTTFGYDGIDIDWEPLDAADGPQYTNLINDLRTAMTAARPQSLLTAAVASQPALFSSLQSKFNQINLMTYDLSGPYPGWVTWFNSPIYDGGYRFSSTGELVPSINGMVNSFISAGVAPSKLGIGIAFYGYVWSGGSGTPTGGATIPRQTWTTAPSSSAFSYDYIMTQYYQPQRYFWDTNAQSAYLKIDNSGSVDDKFISYDDERACQSKVSFARNRGLGGVMIFDLGNGFRSGQPAGQRDPLLQAVKQALATPRIISLLRTNNDAQLNFTTSPLAFYRVLWTSNISSGVWSTLTNSLPGYGANIQILDPINTNHHPRFYRIQTPP
jgi:spore germination protein YaaH